MSIQAQYVPQRIETDPTPVVVVQVVLILVTTLTNVMVILAVLTSKLRHVPHNIFICSLAVSDLVIGVFGMPVDILSWSLEIEWLFFLKCWMPLNLESLVVSYIRSWIMYVSVWNVCVISYDRYHFICHNSSWVSKGMVKLFLISCWLIPALSLAIQFALRRIIADAFPDQKAKARTMPAILGVLTHLVPQMIMTVNYIRILVFTRTRRQRVSVHNRIRLALGKQEINFKRTLYIIGGLVSGVYLLYFPMEIYIVYVIITEVMNCRVIYVVSWMAYANSAVNPFIYTLFNTDIKAAIVRVLRCKSEIIQEASSQTDRSCPEVSTRALSRIIGQEDNPSMRMDKKDKLITDNLQVPDHLSDFDKLSATNKPRSDQST